MDVDGSRDAIEAARDEGGRLGVEFAEVLVGRLAGLSREEILSHQECFDEVHDAVYRWDGWAAAYLIGGGCPDESAGHPVVIEAAARGDDYVIFDEGVNYAAGRAFERLTGDVGAFCEEWERHRAGRDEEVPQESDMGEDFDFDDAGEMHRRLPRLAALLLAEVAG
ncbi:DUF4240 domain-containing protein [Kitasatospora sp. NRRL B-11411]|uniref:DUF4240 domain-containing protein n=1 Tax=Kitasatospora sp. NRRL B-11411 TaxID=1463822 RepID=UPI0004C3ABBF|nr:DUF4240 domain-containing protein [Kitasatospora sp. NRRL B-11411]